MTQEEKAADVMAIWAGWKPCLSCGVYIAPKARRNGPGWRLPGFHPEIVLCTVCKKLPVKCVTCSKTYSLFSIRWHRSWNTGKVEPCCGYCRRRIGIHKSWESPVLVPAMIPTSLYASLPEDNM